MSRVLVLGMGPLPFENTEKTFGPGIRTWHFIQPLVADGHQVCLAAHRIPFIYPPETPAYRQIDGPGFDYHSLDQSTYEDGRTVAGIARCFRPDAVLAVTIFATQPLESLGLDAPVWIDQFGHVMAEAQAKAFRYGSDQYLGRFYRYEERALRRGDIFSAVSGAQRYATIGELGLAGRLSAATTGYEFVHVIPCAMEGDPYVRGGPVIRGRELPEDAFVVLWSGGYNTWTDIDTLFAGLTRAMAANPAIHFVSTGGAIEGHDERTYPRLLRLIAASPLRGRFHMRGWIPRRQVPAYYFDANVGVNIDEPMYEGLLGSKNRVLDWMRAGLPALVGELCELSGELPRERIGYSYPLKDPEALSAALLELAADPETVAATGRRALAYGLAHLTFETTTRPFRLWLANARPAPDRGRAPALAGAAAPADGAGTGRLAGMAAHVEELEGYVRHLEDEIRLRDAFGPRRHLRLALRKLAARALPADAPAGSGRPWPPLPADPLASVVIPVYNGADFLPACLESVSAGSHGRFELVLVDNASSDGSADLAGRLAPEAKLLRNRRNRGFAAACNQGVRAAAGDVIVLLNQDTVVEPGWLAALVARLAADPLAGIVGCKIFYPDGETLQHAGGVLHANGLTNHLGDGTRDCGAFDEAAEVDYVTGAAFAFRRSLIDRIGLFDEGYRPAYFEELDFCLRARRAGFKVLFEPAARLRHFESQSSGKFSPVFYYRYHRNRLRFAAKCLSGRRLLLGFVPFELRWIRRSLPAEQVRPLARAYLANALLLPATLAARWRSRSRR